MKFNISAIILMGGKGERFGSIVPKQFHNLAGKPVFIHTLEKFICSGSFTEVVLVCPKEWIAEVKKIKDLETSTSINVVAGGATRRQSSFQGLLSVRKDTTHVVIHDAVRPFVTQKIIQDNIENAIKYGCVDTCIPSSDTIVHSQDLAYIDHIPARKNFLRGQTPQSFLLSKILHAHKQAELDSENEVTDDCSLITRLGEKVYVANGDEHNIKITTELDLYLAEQILRMSQKSYGIKSVDNFQNKLYVVTGGTGGIGSEICSQLSKLGAKVIPLSRSSEEFRVDLCDADATESVFKEIQKKYGEIDGLINSIGALLYDPFKNLCKEKLTHLTQTNLMAILYSCRYAYIKKKGHILNIASSSYFKGRKNYAVYSACKAATVNFTQGLAEENPELYINILAPQRTLTPLRIINFPSESASDLLTQEEVANAAIEILGRSTTGTIFDLRKNYGTLD
jgi:2-C-methyl-D-erythritol 4-phosphate cytidylyltransferase